MIINLLEIPPEGKTFICNNKTTEFNESLRDLIGKIPHQTEFTILPLSSGTYELSGWIRTELPEDCSRCGLDFNLKVDEKFRELLMPSMEAPRNSKYTKVNHVSDMKNEGLTVVEYQGHHFNAGEYLHEVVAISEPLSPVPECDATGKCLVCLKPVPAEKFSYEDPGFEDADEEQPQSPFSALKNIKLN